ncbi:MAG TPA: RNase adapter RapZ [Candidatus Limnocylindrales bacterium]|nr:RNase adapter RapZ [Candidatus Limnocylindrales bacterium]
MCGRRIHPCAARLDRHLDRELADLPSGPLTDAPERDSSAPPFVVVTGMSGAGKTQAVKVFEDLDYYILDNLPPALMPSALAECRRGGRERVAFVIDARSGSLFREATASLDALATAGDRPHVLFFDASDEVLLQRYSESRHRHPLEMSGGVQPSIDEERRMLVDLRARADKVIDTTHLSVKDLRDTLHSVYGAGTPAMLVELASFGYKFGLPPAADLVFDVRFMENPFYIPALRDKDGRDDAVRAFVLGHPATREFLDHLIPFLRFALPRYEEEKKARLSIALGCTGGRHRSVVIAEEVAKRLRGIWPGEIAVAHRDVDRVAVRT